MRTDPTQVRVGRLDDVTTCPLAARIRKALRKRGAGVEVMCVYSQEARAAGNGDADGGEGAAEGAEGEEETMARGRKRRTLGSLPTLTGIFGLTAANAAIELIIGGFER